jgi:hypothetical protein
MGDFQAILSGVKTEEEKLYGWFQQDSMSMQALMSSGTELAAVVFGQHIHLTLNLVILHSRIV